MCNPRWQEIADALSLEPGQVHFDSPNIVTRVFTKKLDGLILISRESQRGIAFGHVIVVSIWHLFLLLIY